MTFRKLICDRKKNGVDMVKTLFRKYLVTIGAIFLVFIHVKSQELPIKERLIPFIHPVDNYGSLNSHAFNSETGTLVCIYSTGEVKSYNIYTRICNTYPAFSSGNDLHVDVSDDGYIIVCCPYKKGVLINTHSADTTIKTIDEAYFVAFIPGQKEVIIGKDPSYAKENTLAVYSYPEMVLKKRCEISWDGKTHSDSAKFLTVRRYGNKLIAEVCLNNYMYFHEEDTLQLDTLYKCRDWKKIDIELPGLKGGNSLSNSDNDIDFFTTLPDSLMPDTILFNEREFCERNVMGDLSEDKSKILFSKDKEIYELDLKTGKSRSFGAIERIKRYLDPVTMKNYEDINGYEYYTGLYYTKEGNILSVNNSGEVLLWKSVK